MNTQTTYCFWFRPPGTRVPKFLEAAVINEQGHIVGERSGYTLERWAQCVPAPVLTDLHTLESFEQDAFLKAPVRRISCDSFCMVLNLMPPLNWRNLGRVEMFVFGTPVRRGYRDIHAIYLRVGGHCWAFYGHPDISIFEAMDRVKQGGAA